MKKIQFLGLPYLIISLSSCGLLHKFAPMNNADNLLPKQAIGNNGYSNEILQNRSNSSAIIDSDLTKQKYNISLIPIPHEIGNNAIFSLKKNINIAISIPLKKNFSSSYLKTPLKPISISKIESPEFNIYYTWALVFLLFTLLLILLFLIISEISLFYAGIIILLFGASVLTTLVFFILGLFH